MQDFCPQLKFQIGHRSPNNIEIPNLGEEVILQQYSKHSLNK